MTNPKFERLKELYGEIADLGHAQALLSWDQQTYMPPNGAEARGQQMATLSGISHEKLTAPEIGDLVGELKSDSSLDEMQRAFLRELEFARDRTMKLPLSLVKELSLETSRAFGVWAQAKTQKKFALFAPNLKKVTELTRQSAECWGYEGTPWNALATAYERGLTAEKARAFLDPLRQSTVKLLDRILSRPPVDASFLEQKWDVSIQREFGLRVARDIGYDLSGGRQDVAPHPFCTTLGHGDVRITTRYSESTLLDSVLATIHESGHAMYDQGIRADFARTPLHEGAGLGVHESQSRFWEVRIAHSLPFWQNYLPILRQYFPGQLDGITPERFYRAANRVRPDFLRVEADEVCYNLHVVIRFELEVRIFDGDLSIDDLPAAWNELYRKYLFLDVPDDAKGCLQDVHWAYGSYGYFPTYSLGNIYNAMLVEKMEADMPDLWDQVASGRFGNILAWLRREIHQHGSMYLPGDLIRRVTTRDITSAPLVNYLEKKYAAIYGF